jgi:isocitrate dehydrogenase kinase/phosphatase
MRAGAWFYVAPNDVFPEQFIQCIGLSPELRQLFRQWHGELLTANWWSQMRTRLVEGETIDVLPYSLNSRVTLAPGGAHYAVTQRRASATDHAGGLAAPPQ